MHQLFSITADRDLIVVSAPSGEATRLKAMLIQDHKGYVLTYGMSPQEVDVQAQQEMEKKAPSEWAKQWTKNKAKHRHVQPLSPAAFDPILAAQLIQLAVYQLLSIQRQAAGQTQAGSFLEVKTEAALDLNFAELARLSQKDRELFAHYLQQSHFIRVKSLVLNAEPQSAKAARRAYWAHGCGVPIFIGLMIYPYYRLLLYLLSFLPENIGLTSAQALAGIGLVIGSIGVFAVLLYIPIFILSFVWRLAFKNSLPDSVSREIEEKAKWGLPGFWLNLLYGKK